MAEDTPSVFEAVVWLVPVAVLLTGVRYPRGGILVLVAAIPLFGSPPGGPYLGALDVAALLAIVTSWRGARARRSPLDVAALGFVVVGLASLVPLAWHPPSWNPHVLPGLLLEFPYVERWSILYTWRAATNLVIGWLLFAGVRRSFRRENIIELGWALALGEALVLVLGLAEFAGLINLSEYRVVGAPMFDARLHSLFFHSGWLAEFLVVATPVAATSVWRIPRWGAVAASGLVVLALPAIILTEQRGAWICLALELALGGILLGRATLSQSGRRRRLLLASLFIVLFVFALGAAILIVNPAASHALAERLGVVGSDLSGRARVWSRTWEVALKRPVLGWGIGSFSPVYDLVATPGTRHQSIWLTAHNQYLMLFVERGLLAVLVFLLTGFVAASMLRRQLRSRDALAGLSVGLLLSVVVVGLYGVVQYLFFLRAIEWLLWILLGAVAVITAGTRLRWADWVAWAILLLAAVSAVARAGQEPAPRRGDREYGVHAPDTVQGRTHRWTSGHAAMRRTRRRGQLVLEFANGHPHAAQYPVALTIAVDGKPVRSLLLESSDWQKVVLPSTEFSKPYFVLGLTADPTFRPFEDAATDPTLPATRDIRRLGVAMKPMSWMRTGLEDRPPHAKK